MDFNKDTLILLELLTLQVSIVYIMYKYFCGRFNDFRRQGIPGPRPAPVFGTWWSSWKHNVHELGRKYYAEYGDIYCTFRGRTPVLRIQNPGLVQSILGKDCWKHFGGRNRRPVSGGNDYVNKTLALLHGEQAKVLRNLLLTVFTPQLVNRRFGMANSSIIEFVSNWNGRISSNLKEPAIMDLRLEAEMLCEEVMLNYNFGKKLGTVGQPRHQFVLNARKAMETRAQNWLETLTHLYPQVFNWLSPILGNNGMNYFVEMSKCILKERSSASSHSSSTRNSSSEDLVDRLLACISGSDPKAESYIDEVVAIAQIASILLSGYDTSTALTRVLHCLTMNPEEQKKCREELRVALVKSGGDISYRLLSELRYLESCVREALRLYSITFATTRICTKSKQYKHIFIPKGTAIELPIFLIQRDQEIFQEPLKYKPDRFLPSSTDKGKAFANFYGFGQGPRSCPAQKFATTALKHCLAHILLEFEFFPVPETSDPMKMASGPSGILTAQDTWVGFKKVKQY